MLGSPLPLVTRRSLPSTGAAKRAAYYRERPTPMSRHIRLPRARANFYQQIRAYQGRVLRDALHRAGGNQSEAARYLGITRSAFWGQYRRLAPLADQHEQTSDVAMIPVGYAVLKTRRGLPLLIVTCWTRADLMKVIRDSKLVSLHSTYSVALSIASHDRVIPVRPATVRQDGGGYPSLVKVS